MTITATTSFDVTPGVIKNRPFNYSTSKTIFDWQKRQLSRGNNNHAWPKCFRHWSSHTR